MTTVICVILIGWASQYSLGVMERTIAVRQAGRTAYDLPMDLPDVDGYVAVLDPAWIGKIVKLRPAGAAEWETFLVADCAGRNDKRKSDDLSGADWMRKYNVLVEVDYETAVRWNIAGKVVRVEMLAPDPCEWACRNRDLVD